MDSIANRSQQDQIEHSRGRGDERPVSSNSLLKMSGRARWWRPRCPTSQHRRRSPGLIGNQHDLGARVGDSR
jgi:hypothetical protein